MSQSTRPVALITGGTGGIGLAISTLLADAGYDIAFTYRSNADKATALTLDLQKAGARVHAQSVDLSDPDSVDELFATTTASLGAPSAVVHASGPYVEQRYLSTFTSAQFRSHVQDELLAFFELTRCALPSLRETSGSLTAVTSVGVRRFPAKDALSSVPKGGIEALVRATALEEGRFGVRANAVAPGILADGMMDKLSSTGDVPKSQKDHLERTIPLRRLGLARDVAAAVCFLASPGAAYITGQVLDVDGGYSL